MASGTPSAMIRALPVKALFSGGSNTYTALAAMAAQSTILVI
jgi:hypothetical protein